MRWPPLTGTSRCAGRRSLEPAQGVITPPARVHIGGARLADRVQHFQALLAEGYVLESVQDLAAAAGRSAAQPPEVEDRWLPPAARGSWPTIDGRLAGRDRALPHLIEQPDLHLLAAGDPNDIGRPSVDQ